MKLKEIRKRLAGLGLAIVLTVTGVLPAAAAEAPVDEIAGYSAIQEEEYDSTTQEETGFESQEDTQPVVTESAADETADPAEPEITEIATDENADSGEVVEEISAFSVEESTDSAISFADKNGDETVIHVEGKNLTQTTTGVYKLAVWSQENGQDDIKWYNLVRNGETDVYEIDLPITNHKSAGLYHAHLYLYEPEKGMQLVLTDNFTISSVTAEKIEVTDVNKDKGTATVTVSGVKCPSGIKKVEIPVWTTSNQSDIYWYNGTKVSDGVYRFTLDISKHAYHYGTYHIHAYGTSGIGARNFLLSTKCVMERGEINLEAIEGTSGYTLKASNLNLSDAADVKFAVWSAKNGQDDLKWLTVNPTSTGTVTTKWTPKEYGLHYIHCYVHTKSGAMIFQKDIQVDLKGPKVSEMSITADQKTGKFSIRLSGVEGVQQISQIQVPVWSDPKQADIVWYVAARQADGTYLVNGDISKHKYNFGTYNAHVYIRDAKNTPYFQLKDTFQMAVSCDGVSSEDVSGEDAPYSAYLVKAENLMIPGGISKVEFAVWSQDNGQDDIRWYAGAADGNSYSYTVKTANHKSAGKYFVHCYATTKSGSKVFVGATEFNVNLSAEASIRLIEKNDAEGTFTVGIKIAESSSNIAGLKVPVWVNADKSDLYEYTATVSDDEMLVTVNAANHKYHFGTYNIQARVEFAAGFAITAGQTTVSFSPANFLSIKKTAEGKRTVTISNVPSTTKTVQFPTWSKTNAQDDIVWYNGTKQADGSWTAEIMGYNLKHEGDVITHCYVDGVFAGAVASSFTKAEIESRIGTQKVKKYAQALIAANGGDLYRIYKWIVNSYTYVTKPIPVPYPNGYTRQEFYFTDAYETRLTNCFGFAATFYWVAKEMGYDVTLKEASVRYRSGNYGPHGWVEVRRNGTTYICDPELEYEKGINSYMVTYASSPFSYAPNTPAY